MKTECALCKTTFWNKSGRTTATSATINKKYHFPLRMFTFYFEIIMHHDQLSINITLIGRWRWKTQHHWWWRCSLLFPAVSLFSACVHAAVGLNKHSFVEDSRLDSQQLQQLPTPTENHGERCQNVLKCRKWQIKGRIWINEWRNITKVDAPIHLPYTCSSLSLVLPCVCHLFVALFHVSPSALHSSRAEGAKGYMDQVSVNVSSRLIQVRLSLCWFRGAALWKAFLPLPKFQIQYHHKLQLAQINGEH